MTPTQCMRIHGESSLETGLKRHLDVGVKDMMGKLPPPEEDPGIAVTPAQLTWLMIPKNGGMIGRGGTAKPATLSRDLSGSDSRTRFALMAIHIVRRAFRQELLAQCTDCGQVPRPGPKDSPKRI